VRASNVSCRSAEAAVVACQCQQVRPAAQVKANARCQQANRRTARIAVAPEDRTHSLFAQRGDKRSERRVTLQEKAEMYADMATQVVAGAPMRVSI